MSQYGPLHVYDEFNNAYQSPCQDESKGEGERGKGEAKVIKVERKERDKKKQRKKKSKSSQYRVTSKNNSLDLLYIHVPGIVFFLIELQLITMWYYFQYTAKWGFLGGSVVKNSPADTGNCMSNPWVRKIPWRRTWQPTPVFLPGKSHGQSSLVE